MKSLLPLGLEVKEPKYVALLALLALLATGGAAGPAGPVPPDEPLSSDHTTCPAVGPAGPAGHAPPDESMMMSSHPPACPAAEMPSSSAVLGQMRLHPAAAALRPAAASEVEVAARARR